MKQTTAEKEQFGIIVKESKILEKKIKAEMAAFQARYGCRLFLENTSLGGEPGWQFFVGKEIVPGKQRP